MDKEAYENMIIRSNLSDLKKYIDPDNLLKEWGGTFDFDVASYIAWRAKEEGVSVSGLTARRFDPKENKNEGIEDSFATMSSKAMSTFEPAPSKVSEGGEWWRVGWKVVGWGRMQ